MSLQEWAVAIGLLTPLVLGILAFIEKLANRKKGEGPTDEPAVIQGMTVSSNSYADDLIIQLKKELAEAEQEIVILRDRLERKGRNG